MRRTLDIPFSVVNAPRKFVDCIQKSRNLVEVSKPHYLIASDIH
jgi:hypothetical protein